MGRNPEAKAPRRAKRKRPRGAWTKGLQATSVLMFPATARSGKAASRDALPEVAGVWRMARLAPAEAGAAAGAAAGTAAGGRALISRRVPRSGSPTAEATGTATRTRTRPGKAAAGGDPPAAAVPARRWATRKPPFPSPRRMRGSTPPLGTTSRARRWVRRAFFTPRTWPTRWAPVPTPKTLNSAVPWVVAGLPFPWSRKTRSSPRCGSRWSTTSPLKTW
mmetsp:Transcript_12954/g.48442  ORF Transcript_12954/g.48442 Transcript_12954/m.48442 type:complete len:220 (+) Transcript_12954:702-1361(+)